MPRCCRGSSRVPFVASAPFVRRAVAVGPRGRSTRGSGRLRAPSRCAVRARARARSVLARRARCVRTPAAVAQSCSIETDEQQRHRDGSRPRRSRRLDSAAPAASAPNPARRRRRCARTAARTGCARSCRPRAVLLDGHAHAHRAEHAAAHVQVPALEVAAGEDHAAAAPQRRLDARARARRARASARSRCCGCAGSAGPSRGAERRRQGDRPWRRRPPSRAAGWSM